MKKFIFLLLMVMITTYYSSAQIPNGGFESWTNMSTYNNPDGWATLNDMTAPVSIFTCTQGTPGNPGNYYMKLTSKSIWGMGILPGFAVCGTIDTTSMLPLGGFPFTSRPANFTGNWQHMIFGSSQGYIDVTLSYWDPGTQTRIPVANAHQVLSGMAMNWAPFSIPLTYVSGQAPDSCIIVLSSSGNTPAANDYLWVDNLAFSGSVSGITENIGFSGLVISPNPALDELTVDLSLITSQPVSLQIFNLLGLQVMNQQELMAGEKNKLDISLLPAGAYLLKFHSEKEEYTGTFVKK